MPAPSKSRIGEILLEYTSITPEQLDEALRLQRDLGIKLGEILIQKNYLTPEELLKALSIQLGIPYYHEIPTADVDIQLVAHLPINFAKQHELIPICRHNDSVIVAISDPLKLDILDDLRVLLKSKIKPVLASGTKIQDAINKVYERRTEKGEIRDIVGDEPDLTYNLEEPVDLLDADDEAPIIRLVNTLLFRAIKEKASDIHIEPYERELAVRFRIDGVLYDIYKPPKRFQNSIISRVKVMADLNIAEKRLPQDGRIRIKIAGKDIDIRISTIPTTHGERVVMRLLDKSAVPLELPELGFRGDVLEHINGLIQKKHGIILVTGPTGSGKSTTLYACLTKINSVERNIITVEDPVEFQLKGVGQIQVNPKINLTFATGLRSILRQDPDVIMVGEIRDVETAEIAIQASLTGHLVLSTVHTNDAPGAITRLVDMGIEPFLVSSSILAVLAQRLVRKVCPYCREEYIPPLPQLEEMGITEEQLHGRKIYRAVGCQRCMGTGYMGRTAINELMIIDDLIRQLILQNVDSTTIKKEAIKRGMCTLRDDGILKVLEGDTSIEEILRATQVDVI